MPWQGSVAGGVAGSAVEVVLSCEHAGCRIPPRCAPLFSSAAARRALASHRGWDPGALPAARYLARRWEAPLWAWTTSRLIADPNRSAHHRGVLSEFTRSLQAAERAELLEHFHRPHRERVEEQIAQRIERGSIVVHVGVHTFTPCFRGSLRPIDVGLLYDPRRPNERRFCQRWAGQLQQRSPTLRVRRNAPYRGATDGLTTTLRRRFPAAQYLGVELEISQRYGRRPVAAARAEQRRVWEAIRAAFPLDWASTR